MAFPNSKISIRPSKIGRPKPPIQACPQTFCGPPQPKLCRPQYTRQKDSITTFLEKLIQKKRNSYTIVQRLFKNKNNRGPNLGQIYLNKLIANEARHMLAIVIINICNEVNDAFLVNKQRVTIGKKCNRLLIIAL